MNPKKIFICSTCHDLKDLRAELKDALKKWGYEPILSEYSGEFSVEVGVDSYTACIEAVKKSDMLILIVGKRYGGRVPDKDISITELEYNTAAENGIHRINFCSKEIWSLVQVWKENQDMKFPKDFKDGHEIMKFLDRIRKVEEGKTDNWIHLFETSVDIKEILKTQLGVKDSEDAMDKGIKKFDEVVYSKLKWTDIRSIKQKLKPSIEDFKKGRIEVPKYFRDQVLSHLEEKHFCIVVGDMNIGKTWLSYAVGYNLEVEQEKDVNFVIVNDEFNGDKAWDVIKGFKGKNLRYFIIEDCHTNSEESEEFLLNILDEKEDNLRFLFTMRKIGKFLLRNEEKQDTFYKEGTERGWILPILPDEISKEHVKKIIKKFIEVKSIKYKVLEQELESVANKWGNDLYLVWLRLVLWKYDEEKLSEIPDDRIYEYVWSNEGEIKLEKRKEILLPISTFCQFESLKVYKPFLTEKTEKSQEMLKDLEIEGIVSLSNWGGYDFVSISESNATLFLLTLSRKGYHFGKRERETQIQIFKDYLKSDPPNWYTVFYALAREDEKSDFAKEILIFLLNDFDAWEIVRENAKDISLRQTVFLLDILSWAGENGKALEIERQYKKLHYKELQDKIKSASATTIRNYLPLLSHIVGLNTFFEACSISDYMHIINSSTINTIRLLFIDFKKWKLYFAAKTMIVALLDADLARLVQKSTSLYRLGGLIKEVKEGDGSAATKFVEKLSEIDLNELFSQNDPDAEEKGLTKEQVVNHFLEKRISFALPQGGRIVSKIKDDVWNSLIHSASPKDGFWLLWDIYRYSEDKAKHLVKNNIGQFLLKTCDDEFFRMALIGLLHLCDFEIKNVDLPIDTRGLLENKLHKNTQIVLSLIALIVKLPPSSFQFFDIIKYTKERVNSIPDDPQLKELLQKLIDTYL